MSPEVQIVADKILQTYKGWGRDSTFQSRRESWDEFLKDPAAVDRLESFQIDHLEAAWLKTKIDNPNGVILFVHGGGFQIGSVVSHAEMVGRLVDLSGRDALLFNYRLAPEYIFPAALDDTMAAYEFLLESGYTPRDIALVGDSAGANLILGLIQNFKKSARTLPSHLCLMSPWTDMQFRGDSYVTRSAVDPIHQKKMLERSARTYLGEHDPKDPLVSPLNGDVSGFPPTLIQVGDLETVLSDAEDFAALLKREGVFCKLQVWPDMIHVFQQFPQLPQANEAIAEIAEFLFGQNQ